MLQGYGEVAAVGSRVIFDNLDRPGNLGGPDTWEDAGS